MPKTKKCRRRPVYHYEGNIAISSSKRIAFYKMREIDRQIRILVEELGLHIGMRWYPKLEKERGRVNNDKSVF